MADTKLFILAPKGGDHCTNETTSTTRTSLPNSNKWSELQLEMSQLILKILDSTNFVDVHRFKAVCTSWETAAKLYAYAAVALALPPQSPWLMHRGHEEVLVVLLISSASLALRRKGLHDEECV